MAAQIRLYSIVHGKRKGLASCTNDPIIFVRRHSNMWWGPLRPRGSRTCSPWWEWVWPPRWSPPFEPGRRTEMSDVSSVRRRNSIRKNRSHAYLACGRFGGNYSPDCRRWGSRASSPGRGRSTRPTDSCRSCASVRNARQRDGDKPSFAGTWRYFIIGIQFTVCTLESVTKLYIWCNISICSRIFDRVI